METPVWDVLVVGGANIDYLARGPELPGPEKPIQGDQFRESPGGKGANQAVGAARLGARVAFVGCLGQDARGDWILARFADEQVDTRYVLRDPTELTGVVLIQVDQQGQKQTLAVLGANRRLKASDLPQNAIASTRVLLVQLEIPLAVVEAAIHQAHSAGVTVVLDPAPAQPLPDEILRQVDVIKPDAGEAQVLTGISVHDRDTAREAARQLLARGVGAVAVEAGQAGNLLVWKGEESWSPLLPVKTVDTTGAGDAYAAALAVCLARGRSLEETGPFANAAAAFATTRLGGQADLPYWKDVEQLLRKMDMKERAELKRKKE